MLDMKTFIVSRSIFGTGGGSSSGGSAESGDGELLYKPITWAQVHDRNHAAFDFNGTTYYYSVTGTNGNARIYSFDGETFTKVIDVPSSFATYLALDILVETIVFHDKVFFRSSKSVGTWDGTTFEMITTDLTADISYTDSDGVQSFNIIDDKLYYLLVNSRNIYILLYNETNNAFEYQGNFRAGSYLGPIFTYNGELYCVYQTNLIKIDIVNQSSSIITSSLCVSTYPRRYLVDGNYVYCWYPRDRSYNILRINMETLESEEILPPGVASIMFKHGEDKYMTILNVSDGVSVCKLIE